MLTRLLVVFMFGALSDLAFAQGQSIAKAWTKESGSSSSVGIGIELKPTDSIAFTKQGGQGYGLGSELALGTKNALMLDISYEANNLSEASFDQKVHDGELRETLANDGFVIRRYQSWQPILGWRWYENNIASSFYADIRTAYHHQRADFYVSDLLEVEALTQSVKPQSTLGYRFVWAHLSARLGVGIEGIVYQHSTVGEAATSTSTKTALVETEKQNLAESLRERDQRALYSASALVELGIGIFF